MCKVPAKLFDVDHLTFLERDRHIHMHVHVHVHVYAENRSLYSEPWANAFGNNDQSYIAPLMTPCKDLHIIREFL